MHRIWLYAYMEQKFNVSNYPEYRDTEVGFGRWPLVSLRESNLGTGAERKFFLNLDLWESLIGR